MMSLFEKLQSTKASIALTGDASSRAARILEDWYKRSLFDSEKYSDPRSLMRSRHKVFSQFGQDGIIGEIFRRIGPARGAAIEIGVAPLENNTALLLLQGWQVLWIDPALPDEGQLPSGLRAKAKAGELRHERHFLTRENGYELVKSRFDQLDFISLDIDYNTFHLFGEVVKARPRVICVEYNSHFPAQVSWIAPYLPEGQWDGSISYGASLKAFEERAAEAGYLLVGCELSGTDAFFVRSDLVEDKFQGPFTSEQHWEPPRFFLDHQVGHRIDFPF
jgi:hypothetical protein